MPVLAKILISMMLIFSLFITLVIICYFLIWRSRYYDKKKRWKRCRVCGKTPSDIYFDNSYYFTRYYCLEHSKENYEKRKTKN